MATIGWFAGGKLIPATVTTWNNEIGVLVGIVLGLGSAYLTTKMLSRYESSI